MTGRFLKCDKPPQFRLKPEIYFKIEKEKELFLTNKEVIDIIQDSKKKNCVKVTLRINKEKKISFVNLQKKKSHH